MDLRKPSSVSPLTTSTAKSDSGEKKAVVQRKHAVELDLNAGYLGISGVSSANQKTATFLTKVNQGARLGYGVSLFSKHSKTWFRLGFRKLVFQPPEKTWVERDRQNSASAFLEQEWWLSPAWSLGLGAGAAQEPFYVASGESSFYFEEVWIPKAYLFTSWDFYRKRLFTLGVSGRAAYLMRVAAWEHTILQGMQYRGAFTLKKNFGAVGFRCGVYYDQQNQNIQPLGRQVNDMGLETGLQVSF